jgi:Ca2+-binding RTX toxin-like protein
MQHYTTRITRAACALLAALLLALLAGGATPAWATAPGTVVVWGDTSHNQTSVPAGLSDVTAMAAGYFHSLALKRDGTVVAWGGNSSGQSSVSPGLRDVTAIAAGTSYSLALTRDGTVVDWGDNFSGQSNVPPGLSGVIVIAAGAAHSLALTRDGTVVAWGRNTHGETSVPSSLHDVTAIAAGYFHSLALVPAVAPSGAQLVADPCDSSKRALLVSGTAGNDTIKIKWAGNPGKAQVVINNTKAGTFQPTGLIIVLGQTGNDTIAVDKKLPQPRILYGNDGNDTMKDDNGSSILIGGSGDDTLDGGDDRDILIGGVGADTLKGGVGDDILIAGSTGYDEASTSNQAALCGFQAEWLRTDVGYAVRMAHLSGASSGGLNGPNLLKATAPGQTVFDDSSKDKLKGEDDQDWFLLNQAGGSAVDTSDRKGSEVAVDL